MKKTAMYGILFMCLFGVLAASAKPYVILQDGNRRVGERIRAKSNGDITLTDENGRMMTFTRNQVRQAVADKPPEYDRAVQAIQGGQPERAIPMLNSIIRQYKFLGWDERAIPLLAQAYIAKEDYKSAVDAYDRAFDSNPDLARKPEVVKEYWNALLQTEQYDKLEELLSDMIQNGPRAGAAQAQIVRGDVKRQRGQTEEALLDYLRTVVFFKQQAAVMPEALYKAGDILAAMRDPRAETMFNTLMKEYGNSPYAQQARAR